jgi:hypothetical protein
MSLSLNWIHARKQKGPNCVLRVCVSLIVEQQAETNGRAKLARVSLACPAFIQHDNFE